MNTKNQALMAKLEKLSGRKLSLGALLYAIRQGEGVSQVEFAKKLSISKQHLCDMEHGRRFVSPKSAFKYAKLLGYSPDQFVKLCLQDLIDRDGIKLIIDVKAA